MAATLDKPGFPDLPLDPARGQANDNRDLLGLEDHAAALAGFIARCSMPMTIGIQGDWGSGKTSLMNLVRAKLGDTKALNIWFNTWQYAQFGNEEQLASSMLVNLMQKIEAIGKPSQSVLHNVSRFIRSVAKATTLSAGDATLSGKSVLDVIDGRGELDGAGLFEQMKKDFSEVINDILTQGAAKSGFERVVIYVDDLDRLAPSKAVELLEAVKNLIDVSGCVFVLAIDYDVVIRGLRQRKEYEADEFRESEGKNFFDKIIQVPYRMPVERYTTEAFLRSHFERVYGELSEDAGAFFDTTAASLIRLSIGNNPRGLKRALNIHSLFAHLMQIGRDEASVSEAERIVTLVFACIQVALPQMYALLSKQGDPFWTLVALAGHEVYQLVGQDDESELFEKFAASIGERARKLHEGSDDDDDDDNQATEDLRALVNDLGRFVQAGETGKHKRIRGLATIALQSIDANGDGVYSKSELRVLDTALRVTSSTSVKADDESEQTEQATTVKRHVGFRELSESLAVFVGRPPLLFWDPETEEYDRNFMRVPDYETDIDRPRVLVDGVPESLKDETLRILRLREERGARDMTSREQSGRITAWNYWVVEGDESERTILEHRTDWKNNLGRGLETRSEAGRAAYDARVQAYLKSRRGEWVTSREVIERVGGTALQVRASLNRLIEGGLVTFQGRARGTRYRAS